MAAARQIPIPKITEKKRVNMTICPPSRCEVYGNDRSISTPSPSLVIPPWQARVISTRGQNVAGCRICRRPKAHQGQIEPYSHNELSSGEAHARQTDIGTCRHRGGVGPSSCY